MTFALVHTFKRALSGCFAVAAIGVAAGCADTSSLPTAPSAAAIVVSSTTASGGGAATLGSFPRKGVLEIEKECSEYNGLPGAFCTITSSNVAAIEAGSRVVYASAPGPTTLDTDVVLDPPGPGNNVAFGHCELNLTTGIGLCTFSGGTGKFTNFQAHANVSSLGGPDWAWDGTYSFDPHD